MLGDWCVGQMIFTWGGTGVTPGTGELQIPLPVANAAFAAPSAARVVPLGAGVLRDASAAAAAQTFDVALVNTGASSSIARLSYYGVTTNNAASGSVPIQLGAAGDTIKSRLRLSHLARYVPGYRRAHGHRTRQAVVHDRRRHRARHSPSAPPPSGCSPITSVETGTAFAFLTPALLIVGYVTGQSVPGAVTSVLSRASVASS
jgi:hypothetical protein